MQRTFQHELSNIKTKYEDAVKLVTEASENLGTLFKNKMIRMKGKLVKFFADIDIRMQQNNNDVVGVSKMMTEWQAQTTGPAQKVEAQIFTIQQLLVQSERDRETQYHHLKENLKHLVAALNDNADVSGNTLMQ